MTGFDQLTMATHTVAFAYFWLGMQCVVASHLLSDLFRRFLARGTRPHYVLTTIVRTTGVPAVVLKMSDIILDFNDGDYILVALDVLVTMYIIMNWFWTKDDDNWWKGRGRKIGRAIRGAFTSIRPATNPA